MGDLSKLDEDVAAVALVAEVAGVEGKAKVTEFSEIGYVKATPAWTAAVNAGSAKAPKPVLRVRRQEGVKPGGVWLIAAIVRTGAKDSGTAWRTEAIDEVYPTQR